MALLYHISDLGVKPLQLGKNSGKLEKILNKPLHGLEPGFVRLKEWAWQVQRTA